MRVLLLVLISVVVFSGGVSCTQTGGGSVAGYVSDYEMDAQAPWKMGEVVARGEVFFSAIRISVERRFLGITNDDHFVVQDFYLDNSKKITEPLW